MVKISISHNHHLVKELVWRKSDDNTAWEISFDGRSFVKIPIDYDYPQLRTNYRKYINFNYSKTELDFSNAFKDIS